MTFDIFYLTSSLADYYLTCQIQPLWFLIKNIVRNLNIFINTFIRYNPKLYFLSINNRKIT